jgi:protein involved in polysaccharide export with SLBB domain
LNFLAAALLAAAVVSNSPSTSDTEPLKFDRPDTNISQWQQVTRYFDQAVDADQYLIRPGDRLVVTFVKTKIPALILFVDPEGRIAHETVGIFDLAGKTLTQARTILDEAIRLVYYADELSISILEPREVTISVNGAVANPGLYRGLTSQRVSEIIERAGGLLPFASRRHIEFRGGPQTIVVDLDRAAFIGDNMFNPCLYAGLSIHVPPKSNDLIQVVGAVNDPRDIEFMPGDNFSTILTLAGGLSVDADTSAVQILGQKSRPFQSGEKLQTGDIVMVPSRPLSAEQSMITVFGAVNTPGRYEFHEGLDMKAVIEKTGGFASDANAKQLTLFRKSTDHSQKSGAARYPIANLVENNRKVKEFSLRAADSIFVPRRLGYVKVSGAVVNPGVFPYSANKDAMHYITAAGGFLGGSAGNSIDRFSPVSKLTVRLDPAGTVFDSDELIVRTSGGQRD